MKRLLLLLALIVDVILPTGAMAYAASALWANDCKFLATAIGAYFVSTLIRLWRSGYAYCFGNAYQRAKRRYEEVPVGAPEAERQRRLEEMLHARNHILENGS